MNSQTNPSGHLIVTIDGPAGSGKTTVARELASRLGLDSLDTGAMYRCVTFIVIDEGVDPTDPPAIIEALARHRIDFDWEATPPSITLDGRSIDPRLREADVNELVSRIASIAEVRDRMVEAQREIASRHPRIVTEGRDQGSVVFPDAEVRFYLDAEASVRAHRRSNELRASGKVVDEAQILSSIEQRDRLDRERSDSPLQVPDGAIRVDTGTMTELQVVGVLEDAVRRHLEGSSPGGGA
ncbi:MAG: (d)CMP kinase [Planctomycetota bacterium]|nr:(d)CMP kinase [Planctomycetota bacterium]